MDPNNLDHYFCKHCKEIIENISMVSSHKCFVGKDYIYECENDNRFLFFKENEPEPGSSQNNDLVEEDREMEENQIRETSDLENVKKNAVWTKSAILAMLSIYECNSDLLKDLNKKSKIWQKISDGLKSLNVEMTPNQVRWKFNRLLTKYKECVDNNNRSGREKMTFEFFNQMEEIFHKSKKESSTNANVLSSSILKSKNHNIVEPKEKKRKLDEACCSKQVTNIEKNEIRPDLKKKTSIQIQCLDLMKTVKDDLKAREESLNKYLKNKEKEIDLKKKALEVREKEIKVKRDIADEKKRLSEKKHEEWLNMEKIKCSLLKKLIKKGSDSDDSD